MSKRQSSKGTEARFGKAAASTQEYQHHLDFRCMENFDDNAFAHQMARVKGVNMLDVNETDISDDSIKFLTTLEYVNELRAKECINLTDDCADDLNKITSLEFLHLKDTGITIDGLLKLKDLLNLKTLMFSADDVPSIKEKLVQLKLLLPKCELVINSKPYYTNAIYIFLAGIKNAPFKTRLKIKNKELDSTWNDSLIRTETGELATDLHSAYQVDDIEWLEINCMPNAEIDKNASSNKPLSFQELTNFLDNLEFPFMIEDGVLSVYLLDKDI